MGDRIVATIMGLLILAVIPFAFNDAFNDAFAVDYKKHVTAEDLGILQLAAHDLFNVFRCNNIDPMCAMEFEDGKLNLSTLFVDTTDPMKTEFPPNVIAMGGEHRNRENIMLFTVASELGVIYVDLIAANVLEDDAKNMVVGLYHIKLADTYKRTFGEAFPSIENFDSTDAELFQQNLALRTIHDALPGKIKFNNKHVSTLDPDLRGEKLNEKELKQKSSKIDGKFDDEFLNINICLDPPDCFVTIMVNLLEADRSFGDQFGTTESFDSLLEQIEDGTYDEGDSVLDHIRTLMAKGQDFPDY